MPCGRCGSTVREVCNVRLICQECQTVIWPDEQMVVVSLGRPNKWATPDLVLKRLEYAPARWHYRCAPEAVRRFASVVST